MEKRWGYAALIKLIKTRSSNQSNKFHHALKDQITSGIPDKEITNSSNQN
jgi:hypothetical protein